MAVIYVQRGETLDYKNTGDAKIESGEIVKIGEKIGVAACDIEVGETGALAVEGVFAFPAASGGSAIEMGAKVYWTGEAAAASGDTLAGYAAAPAEAGAEKILVKINA